MELQLICHGMMLFWYRKPVNKDPDTDGYQILIPQGRIDEKQVHELRLGLDYGAEESVLGYHDQDPTTRATQYWQLDFGNQPSKKSRGPKCPVTNLNFYGDKFTYSTRRAGTTRSSAGVAFVIDIPYPCDENPIRAMDYTNNPYLESGVTRKARVVEGYKVRPRRIVSARVFHFSINDKRISLYRSETNDRREIVARPSSNIIKIHLYNQAKDPPSNNRENHLPLFNKMLQLTTKVDHTHHNGPFDLELNSKRGGSPATLKIPETLIPEDLLDLWQIYKLFGVRGKLRDLRGQFEPRAYDPAECGQGSGCDPDSEPPDPAPFKVKSKAGRKAGKPAAGMRKKR